MSCHVMSCHISCHVTRHVMSCHVTRHVMSCHVTCHVMSHVISRAQTTQSRIRGLENDEGKLTVANLK